jgi:small subunit ribosomal protein S16
VAVKIRLKRLGKIRVPQYRIVVVDSRKKRDGRVIEEIGKYHPKEDPSYIEVVSERAQYWLGVGAQPTEAVAAILKITGDWHTHRGITDGAEGTLKVKAERRSKQDIFNEALKEAGGEAAGAATTAKKVTGKKAAAKDESDAPADKPATTGKATKASKSDKADKAEPEAEVTSDIAPPVDETPEGATADAEDAETAQVDAEQADAKAKAADNEAADAPAEADKS